MTRYNNGRAFEHRVRKLLEEAGYYCTRSAGSKGVADLWAAEKTGGVEFVRMDGQASTFARLLLVQCKREKAAFSQREWNALCDVAWSVGAVPVLCEYVSRKPPKWWRLTGPKIPRKQMEENACVEWKP